MTTAVLEDLDFAVLDGRRPPAEIYNAAFPFLTEPRQALVAIYYGASNRRSIYRVFLGPRGKRNWESVYREWDICLQVLRRSLLNTKVDVNFEECVRDDPGLRAYNHLSFTFPQELEGLHLVKQALYLLMF